MHADERQVEGVAVHERAVVDVGDARRLVRGLGLARGDTGAGGGGLGVPPKLRRRQGEGRRGVRSSSSVSNISGSIGNCNCSSDCSSGSSSCPQPATHQHHAVVGADGVAAGVARPRHRPSTVGHGRRPCGVEGPVVEGALQRVALDAATLGEVRSHVWAVRVQHADDALQGEGEGAESVEQPQAVSSPPPIMGEGGGKIEWHSRRQSPPPPSHTVSEPRKATNSLPSMSTGRTAPRGSWCAQHTLYQPLG